MIYFYDTSELLRELPVLEEEDTLVISDITWQELKRIKDDKRKSERIQRAAKKAISWLTENPFEIVRYDSELESISGYVNDDDRIIHCAGQYYFNEMFDDDFILITHDKAMYLDAIDKDIPVSLTVDINEPINEDYKGFKEVFLNDEELADFYEKGNKFEELQSNLLVNEYLIIKYKKNGNDCEELYKYTVEGLQEVPYYEINNMYYTGTIKPKDIYQRAAMDSLYTNQFTILRGPAGSGKSLLGLNYLLQMLEHNEIDEILVFCNPVATHDSARLGFLPGTRLDKLMDSQVGNFLTAKFTKRIMLEQLIEREDLVLLPVADCRGVDYGNTRAGVYVTEGQNLTVDLMQLIIQRCGSDCKVVIEGDDKSQVDLQAYEGKNNGLRAAVKTFKGEDLFGTVTLEKVHRGRLVEIAECMTKPNVSGSFEYIKS